MQGRDALIDVVTRRLDLQWIGFFITSFNILKSIAQLLRSASQSVCLVAVHRIEYNGGRMSWFEHTRITLEQCRKMWSFCL